MQEARPGDSSPCFLTFRLPICGGCLSVARSQSLRNDFSSSAIAIDLNCVSVNAPLRSRD